MRLVSEASLIAALSLFVASSAAAQSPVRKVPLLPVESLASLSWQPLSSDAKGDGLRPRLPDAKDFAYAIDPKTNLVWFKVSVHEPLPERWFGINIAIDSDAQADNGLTWWGTNKFKLDRLASAYLYTGDGYWQGIAGVSDSEAAGKMLFTSVSENVRVAVDRAQNALLVGVPRADLGTAPTIRVIATVGSMMVNNDDIPNEGSATVKLTP